MSKIRGLIFDLDGVIVSTEKNHYHAWKSIADQLSIFFDEKINESLKGLSRNDSLKLLLEIGEKKVTENEFNNYLALKNEIYLKSIQNLNNNDLLFGVLDFITNMHAKNYKLAIGSSSKNAKYILKKTQLDSYFTSIIDGNAVSHPKPHPEVFLNAAMELKLKPEECIVFEDAVSGVRAAQKGNFNVIGVGNTELKEKCDFFINNFKEFDLVNYEKSI